MSIQAINEQVRLFEEQYEELDQPRYKRQISLLDLDQYDKILVQSSGGKDSGAMVLFLLKMGVPKDRIELWHQCVDGGPGDDPFFDWPVTEAYAKALAEALGIRIEYMWRQGGIKGELLRTNARTKDVEYVRAGSKIHLPTVAGGYSTRRKWPAKAADLKTRWCTGVTKIDVFRRVLCNEPGFKEGKYLVLTGERREESSARFRYLDMEMDHGNTKTRLVHRWRSVIDWPEEKIWEIFAEYKVQPHPAYYLGFSRVSCMTCVFSGPDHWATIREIDPERFRILVELEKELNHTIDHKLTLKHMADRGRSFVGTYPEAANWIAKALTNNFRPKDIFTDRWALPAGAFGGPEGGPT